MDGPRSSADILMHSVVVPVDLKLSLRLLSGHTNVPTFDIVSDDAQSVPGGSLCS